MVFSEAYEAVQESRTAYNEKVERSKYRPIEGTQHFPNVIFKINFAEVSLQFTDPASGLTQIIDTQKFDASQGGTQGKKFYKKDFVVNGKSARIEYTLDVPLYVSEGEKLIKSLEVDIVNVSIPGYELKAEL